MSLILVFASLALNLIPLYLLVCTMTGAPFGMSLLSYSQIASFSYIFYKEYQLDRKTTTHINPHVPGFAFPDTVKRKEYGAPDSL
jgi:hypothetical protein